MEKLDIFIQPTPNPNALKFILDREVLTQGKATFKSARDCLGIPLAEALFDLRGVDQIHFFQNVVTVSKFSFEEWDNLEPAVKTTLENMMPEHNAKFEKKDPEEERRANLSPELRTIEEILDRRIRPGLQGDGGDLSVRDYKDNTVLIKYQGACGTCPSSASGTLEAIRSILRDEFNPEVEVYIAPE